MGGGILSDSGTNLGDRAAVNVSSSLESPVRMDLAAALRRELSLLPVEEEEGAFCVRGTEVGSVDGFDVSLCVLEFGTFDGRMRGGEGGGGLMISIGLIDSGSPMTINGAGGPFFSRIIRIGLLKKDMVDFSAVVWVVGSCEATADGRSGGVL